MMYRLTLLLSSLLLAKNCYALALDDPENGILAEIEREHLLDKINYYRELTASGSTEGYAWTLPAGTNMNQLFWSPCLESIAEDHVGGCSPGEISEAALNTSIFACVGSGGPKFKVFGTAMYAGQSYFSRDEAPTTLNDLYLGIADWYGQAAEWTYGKFCHTEVQECVDGNVPEGDRDACNSLCSDYTQLVWATTRYVGCGYHTCSSPHQTSLHCIFYDKGNTPTHDVYEEGTACSYCDCDRKYKGEEKCCDALCAGYMDDDFYYPPGGPHCDAVDKWDGTADPPSTPDGRDMTECP